MALHSVEGLLDPEADAAVRREWDSLAEAGLPSQARHRGETNAPHVTLSVAPGISLDLEAAVGRAVGEGTGRLPLPVRLGPVVVLGARRLVVARLVVATAPLLTLQADVAAVLKNLDGVPANVEPGRWVPHVTLARGLGADEVGAALAALGAVGDIEGTLVAVRRWDPDLRQVRTIAPLPTMGT